MPFIDSKITLPLTNDQKESLKTKLGEYITSLHKSETWLMVGIEDNYDLWLAGKKLEKGAYVNVSLFGDAGSSAYENLTSQICSLFENELSIPSDKVYISYHPTNDWGWNGRNL
jgi:phenylpyruvate tautomerase PptA (4-oxalocrotonate tautomerase family)